MRSRTTSLAMIAIWSVVLGLACTDGSAYSTGAKPTVTITIDTTVGGLVSAEVIEVVDGITITVRIEGQNHVVRYLGLTVPDGDLDEAGKAFDFNRFLVHNKSVELERDDRVDFDSSGRLIRYVYVNGQMVNLNMLITGHAQVSAFPADFTHRDRFILAQESVRGRIAPDAAQTHGTPLPTPDKFGTLPPLPDDQGLTFTCDFSNNSLPVIKANVDHRTGEQFYHIPGSFFYGTVEINENDGDRWFCTEYEAMAAGWQKSKR